MAEILSISMRHRHFADESAPPSGIRMPRPLRNLLAAAPGGAAAACRTAWTAARTAPGNWVGVPPAVLLGDDPRRPRAMRLRARGSHLDLSMDVGGGVHATAIGRRAIVVAPLLPETAIVSATGGALSAVVRVPFFDGAAITVERVIHRDGAAEIDIRCRCPSHVVRPAGNGGCIPHG